MTKLSFGRIILGAAVVLILLFLMVPVLIVVPLSFSDTRFMTFPPPAYSLRWYHSFFDNPAWIDAARTTLTASICAALLATPLGVCAAYAIQNGTHWIMRYLRTLLMLPLMVPIIIVAVGVFFVYSQAGYVNTLGGLVPVSYTHLRAHETSLHLVCRLLLEKKKTQTQICDHKLTAVRLTASYI